MEPPNAKPEAIKPVIMRPDPIAKVSPEQWSTIQALYCAGVDAKTIAKDYPIKPSSIHSRASKSKWPTPNRITRRANQSAVTDDPASALASLWKDREDKSREKVFQGASKALGRFFATAPVPQSFAEAATAAKLMNEAIKPPSEDEGKGTLNLQILSTQGFAPRKAINVETQNITEH